MEPTYNNCRERRQGTKTGNEDRERKKGSKTGNEEMEPNLGTKTGSHALIFMIHDLFLQLRDPQRQITNNSFPENKTQTRLHHKQFPH